MAMTNEQLLEDLKQYIDGRLTQSETLLRSEMNERFDEVDKRFEDVDKRFGDVDKRFEDVDAKLDTIMEATGEQVHDHERRITKLESQTI